MNLCPTDKAMCTRCLRVPSTKCWRRWTAQARKALFKLYLAKRPYDFGIDYDELADLTANYVSSDILLIVNDAARKALKQQHSKITMAIIKETISATLPSLSTAELAKYEKIKQKMERKEPGRNDRPHIGFN